MARTVQRWRFYSHSSKEGENVPDVRRCPCRDRHNAASGAKRRLGFLDRIGGVIAFPRTARHAVETPTDGSLNPGMLLMASGFVVKAVPASALAAARWRTPAEEIGRA